MKHVGGTRWKIRGKRLMLVCGPYEDETIVWGPFDLTMAVQQACRMLEAIDKLAVTTNTNPLQLALPYVHESWCPSGGPIRTDPCVCQLMKLAPR